MLYITISKGGQTSSKGGGQALHAVHNNIKGGANIQQGGGGGGEANARPPYKKNLLK